ncbi:MAG TPA: NRDE family protein [Kofleriaceae bacterium]
MCTIAFLVDIVPEASLVIAANRDELYARPTRSPERLGPQMAGGVDVLSGGTWLAVRKDGRFAAVTNQRALSTPPAGLRSRGLAVKELASAEDPDQYVHDLDPTRYASMNLAWGDARGVSIAYGRQEGALDVVRLTRGVHVLCNDKLGSAGFPRGERLHHAIDVLVAKQLPLGALLDGLGAALGDHTRVPLADTPPSHLPPELGRELTAVCIHSENYGTRSATLFAAGRAGALAYRASDGRPCTNPFIDRISLLEAP